MSSNYISDGEREYLEKRKAEAAAMELFFEAKNNELVGDIKTYKGINYRMHQRGHYQCVDLPPLSGLDGSFTSTFSLHKIIDDIERMKKLPKSGK